MKIKLDENLSQRCAELFSAAGHDTATGHAENLSGASDREVIGRCSDEGRALVTLDLDFGNPLIFKPSAYHGIAVLRPRGAVSEPELEELCRTLIAGLAVEKLEGELWIVEFGRIRIYQKEAPE